MGSFTFRRSGVHIIRDVLTADEGEFKETEHPRGKGGKFTAGTGYKVGQAAGNVLKAHGFSKQKAPALGPHVFHGPGGHKVTITEPKGGNTTYSSNWKSEHPKHGTLSGSGSSLEQHLNKIKAMESAAATPKQEEAVAKAEANYQGIDVPPTQIGHFNHLAASNGYTLKSITGAENVKEYGKENGASLKIWMSGPEAGKWQAISPGHGPKEGNGSSNLELLLSGKPAPVGTAPWKNMPMMFGSSTNIVQSAPSTPKPIGHLKTYTTIHAARPKPTDVQASAITDYKGSGYHTINGALRHPEEDSHLGQQEAKHIADWLDNAALPEDAVLFRGVKGDYAKILRSVLVKGSVLRSPVS